MSRLCNVPCLVRLAVLSLALVTAIETRAQAKIGTVDMDRVLKEYHKTKEAEGKLNDATNAAKKEYDERADAKRRGSNKTTSRKANLTAPPLLQMQKQRKRNKRTKKLATKKKMKRKLKNFG